MQRITSVLFVGLLLLPSAANPADAPTANWPRWRGPAGGGHSAETGFPVKWDAGNVVWKTPLKGQGQSSPVVWGDRIFLTSAVDAGKQRLVCCVERTSGKVLWEEVAWKGTPEPTHVLNGWASPTCTTDGERVYAFFGKAGLHCYTVEGKHVWSRDLGQFLSKTKRGTAASPVLAGDLVIQNGDSESDPFLFGIDKLTGKTVWKADRPATEGYSTPILMTVNGKQELILNGDPYVAGYDPATGKQLWFCKSFAPRGEPTVAPGKDVVYCVCGQSGEIYSVRPGGSGDVTRSHMAWHTARKTNRDQPSPILVGNYLVVSAIDLITSCYDATTGKELWKERIGSGKTYGSPIAAEGRAYFLTENGETIVLEPGPELKILAKNKVGSSTEEVFRSSITPCRGQLLIRADRTLYCVGQGK